MPTRHIDLSDDQDQFILASVESGRYRNAGDVFRAALRSLERETQQDADKLDGLRTAIDDGDASGSAEPGVFDRVRKRLHLSEVQL